MIIRYMYQHFDFVILCFQLNANIRNGHTILTGLDRHMLLLILSSTICLSIVAMFLLHEVVKKNYVIFDVMIIFKP